MIEQAHEQLIKTIQQRMAASGGCFEDHGGFIFYDLQTPENDTHLRGITINANFKKSEEEALKALLTRLKKEERAKWSVRCHPAISSSINTLLQAAGFVGPDTYPIMTRNSPINWTYKHAVSEASETSVLEPCQALLAEVFKLEKKTAKLVISEKLFLEDRENLLAYIAEDREIRCLGLLTGTADSDIYGLYYIATDSAHRGEGLAKDLVAYLTNRAFAKGAKSVILQASSLGEFVYRHHGYTEIARYANFVFER
ncbi:MAG: GNAT family N-acetyltransferase [Eubacteriales bacterium]|nr:GNAT family N-acetyltransferase [Eubacteriales bacterium]